MRRAVFAWGYRSVDFELSNRFTRHWLANSFSEDNFLSTRIIRQF